MSGLSEKTEEAMRPRATSQVHPQQLRKMRTCVTHLIQDRKRSHMAGALRAENVGEEVVLMGWVQNRRDHGGCIFIDLRDRTGLTQVVFDPSISTEAHGAAGELRGEYVLGISGRVRDRGGNVNSRLATGSIEVAASHLTIFSRAKTPPFPLDDAAHVSEELRLSHRYLDLRRPSLQANLMLRHRFNQVVRQTLDAKGFLELETPFLIKSTPEGARDYVVPSRVHPGQYFALPQSPQLFKQLFMVAGFDRYFQIVRCFRDEDLRAERQPEFTQVDLEMSFCEERDVQDAVEEVLAALWEKLLGRKLALPIERLTYDEAVGTYGSDAPDLRFGLRLVDVGALFANSGFKVFRDILSQGGMVKAINLAELGEVSRRVLDDAAAVAQQHGVQGMAWARVKEDGSWQAPIAKFLTPEEIAAINERLQLRPGQTAVFVAHQPNVVHAALGAVRKHFAREFKLVPEGMHRLCWVTDFPLFEFHAETQRHVPAHHPFTAPQLAPDELHRLTSDPARVKARAYDITLNGVEIGGGSIRIHDRALQQQIFDALGIGEEEAREKFGFLLDALSYGAPPHGGLALGVDRICMQLCGTSSIRDVIAYPKTQKQTDLMLNAPAPLDDAQLKELHLKPVERPSTL